MTILKKVLIAALASGAMGFALPAGAQSSVDSDESAVTVTTQSPIVSTERTVVARGDGSKVITERVVRQRVAVRTCKFNNLPNVAGGVGGAIGGRMILGSTSAEDVNIPGNCALTNR